MSMILNLIPVARETLVQLDANPESITDFLDATEGARDLDKAWHGIHFLLSRDDWGGRLPEATLLAGGTEIGDVDVGYGPARALSPEDAERFYDHLGNISETDFDSRFDARALLDHGIYPEIWDRDLKGEPDGRPYLNEYFRVLKEFFKLVVESKNGVVICMQ